MNSPVDHVYDAQDTVRQTRMWEILTVRKLPFGLLGMFALVAALECVLGSLEGRYLVAFDRESWRHASEAARAEATHAEILTFGDSTIKFGITPSAVESGGGLSTYNLAGFGGTPTYNYLMLKRAVEAGARPKAIVLGFVPGHCRMPAIFYSQQWMLFAEIRECLDMALTTRNASLPGVVLAGRLLPSLRRRFEIQDLVDRRIKGKDLREPGRTYEEHLRLWSELQGADLLDPDRQMSMNVNLNDKFIFPDAWGVEPSQWNYLRRILNLAGEINARVFYVLMPLGGASQAEADRRGLDERQAFMLRKIQAQYPGLVVVDARRAAYPDAAFNDPVHLNMLGALRLSHDLGTVIRQQLDRAGARYAWVGLPTYQPVPDTMLGTARIVLNPTSNDGVVRR